MSGPDVDLIELVDRYFDAWNRQDVSDLLELMHPGAAFYDAFWMETCVGRGLDRYFRDSMDEEPYWYVLVGDAIPTDSGVVCRYSAHHRSGSGPGELLHHGAEVLNVRDGRILTITDFYCSSKKADLEEVADLAARRHGVPSHTTAGLSALKTTRLKARLTAQIDEKRVYLDPDITLSRLAEELGCTFLELCIVVNRGFGTSFEELVDTHRIEHAKELLEAAPSDPDILKQIAAQAGFKSMREFDTKFKKALGITPADFRAHRESDDGPANNMH